MWFHFCTVNCGLRLNGRNLDAWGVWALAAWAAPVRGRVGAVSQSRGTCFWTFFSHSRHPSFFLLCLFLPLAAPSAYLLEGCQKCLPHWLLPWLTKLISAFSLAFAVRWNHDFPILFPILPQVAEVFLSFPFICWVLSTPTPPCSGCQPLAHQGNSLPWFPRGLDPTHPSVTAFL